jgi:diguanylate cyclase (GGDEF)-like protein
MEDEKSGYRQPTDDRLALFRDAADLLLTCRDVHHILRALIEKIHDHFRPATTCLWLLNEAQELNCEAAAGVGAEGLERVRVKLRDVLGGWPHERPEPLLVEDARGDNRFSELELIQHGGQCSVLCVPLRGSKSILGMFMLVQVAPQRDFAGEVASSLALLAMYAAIAVESERHFQHIHALTITDDCTGLYNARHLRMMLDAEIYRSARFGHEFSLVFMDLDYFKSVNDQHGHLIGSRLLASVGDLIKGELRLIDSAFRYGGDEFVLLLPQTSKRNALVVVGRLREALNSKDFLSADRPGIKMTASFGVASFPVDGVSAPELLLKSDQAMYQVKISGGDDIGLASDKGVA